MRNSLAIYVVNYEFKYVVSGCPKSYIGFKMVYNMTVNCNGSCTDDSMRFKVKVVVYTHDKPVYSLSVTALRMIFQ